MKVTALLFSIGLGILLVGCSSSHCRKPSQQMNALLEAKASGKRSQVPASLNEDGTVRVYKYDGSLQCGVAPSMALEDMVRELKGIEVIAQEKAHDGLMHVQVCGSPTGKANVYKIYGKDLAEAQQRGFQAWKFE